MDDEQHTVEFDDQVLAAAPQSNDAAPAKGAAHLVLALCRDQRIVDRDVVHHEARQADLEDGGAPSRPRAAQACATSGSGPCRRRLGSRTASGIGRAFLFALPPAQQERARLLGRRRPRRNRSPPGARRGHGLRPRPRAGRAGAMTSSPCRTRRGGAGVSPNTSRAMRKWRASDCGGVRSPRVAMRSASESAMASKTNGSTARLKRTSARRVSGISRTRKPSRRCWRTRSARNCSNRLLMRRRRQTSRTSSSPDAIVVEERHPARRRRPAARPACRRRGAARPRRAAPAAPAPARPVSAGRREEALAAERGHDLRQERQRLERVVEHVEVMVGVLGDAAAGARPRAARPRGRRGRRGSARRRRRRAGRAGRRARARARSALTAARPPAAAPRRLLEAGDRRQVELVAQAGETHDAHGVVVERARRAGRETPGTQVGEAAAGVDQRARLAALPGARSR